METYMEFLSQRKERGWNVKLRPTVPLEVSEEFMDRYKRLPESYKQFLRLVELCTNKDDTIWFLCESDYIWSDKKGIRWNEFERISREAASEDEAWRKEIESFWDRYVPIVLSVFEKYEFYAVDLKNGTVVYGEEPEFEEVMEIATDFTEFVDMLIKSDLF